MSLLRRRLLRIGAFGSLALGGSAIWVLMTPPPVPEPDRMPDPDQASPLPAISLPGLNDGPPLVSADIAKGGKPVLLNTFASWCAPCLIEAPVLNALHRQGVTIWGIAFRDRPEATTAFLARHGNPYARIGVDLNGQGTGPLGLTGVPETMLVDGGGVVRWRWPAGITEDMARDSLLPRWKAMS